MKILIPKSNLQYALNRVRGAISGRVLNPWMAGVLLKAAEGELLVSATNLDVQISHTTDATVIEPGEALLPIASLLQFVTQFPEQEVELAVDDKFHCTLVCGDSRGSLSGVDAKDFTPFPPQERKGFTMAQADLKAALRKVVYAVADPSQTRIALEGVLIEQRSNRLTFAATDGRRLSLVKQLIDGEDVRGTIPTKTVIETIRLLGDEGEVEIWVGNSTCQFACDKTTIVESKLIDAQFPNYKQVLPSEFTESITLSREELLDAVRFVGWVCNAKDASKAYLEFDKNKITLTGKSDDTKAVKTLACRFSGKSMEAVLNPEYMTDVLNALTDDEVRFEFIDNLSPFSFKAGNFQGIIMPLRP